jgi:hypothetical protein
MRRERYVEIESHSNAMPGEQAQATNVSSFLASEWMSLTWRR